MSTIVSQTGTRRVVVIDNKEDVDIDLIYLDEDDIPVDLTGMSLQWTFTIDGITLTATIGAGLTVATPEDGRIVLHFEALAEDIEQNILPQGLGSHRLMITNPVVRTITRGALVNDS